MKEEAQNRFISKFETTLKEVPNKEYLIKNEISQIEALINYKENTIITSPSNIFRTNPTNNRTVFDLSYFSSTDLIMDIFHNYILHGNLDNLNIEKTHFNKSAFEIGVEFAEYYLWLKELTVPKPKDRFTELTIEQRLLAISFLCPDLKHYTKTQSAKVLHQVLDIGKESVRKNLSNLFVYKKDGQVRTLENLYKVAELFENKAFEHITNEIEKEIKYIKG